MRMLIFVLTVALTGVAAVGTSAQAPEASSASAQETEAERAKSAAEERATEFVGVEGADAERIPGGGLLLAAYGVVWVFLFLYLMRIRGLQRNVAAELERLTAKSQAAAD